MAATASVDTPLSLDTKRRYVRICGERGKGFIEFEFAIGEPEVFAEMILDRQAFEDFCRLHQAEMLPPKEDAGLAVSDWDWRMSNATKTRFK